MNDALRLWLEQSPDLDAITMLQRLQGERPGQHPDRLRRTLQRRVQIWRRQLAQRLVIGNAGEISFYGGEEHFR